MINLIISEKMRACERNTFDAGIPPIAVMEYAAAGITEFICKKFTPGMRICVVCGKGNNGGDGLAAARQLFSRGYDVSIMPVFGEFSTDDARLNFKMANAFGVPVVSGYENFKNCDVIIDAIFGIGVSGDVNLEIIDFINASPAYKIAVDIPSGICADTGKICGMAVKADATITFGYKKAGLALYPGADFAGEVAVHDIALLPTETDTFEPESKDIKSMLCDMPGDANKGTFGKLLIIAGSVGMTGAAHLACLGALRSGAGTVTLAVPENLNEIMEKKLTEAMTVPLKCTDNITFNAAKPILEKLSSYSAVVIGPGIGKSEEVFKIIENIIKSGVPAVIDADGINSLAMNIDILKQCKSPVVLTPHPGEFSRLTGLTIEEIQNDRLSAARKFALEYGVTLVLKGAGTVTAMPDGRCFVNNTGNAGMATGGSGDVLAGIAGALIAQKCENAAVSAVYLHGLAGDFVAGRLGKRSMLPTDVAESLPQAFKCL